MFLALVAAVALESPPSTSVEMTRTGAPGAPVSAAPRSLSDVAREMREGRRASGGFSAVESTVPRTSFDPSLLYVEEERRRAEPEVVTEPEPAGYVSNDVYGWGGGGWAPPPRRRPPHVSHHGSNGTDRRRERGGGGGIVVRPPVRAGASTSSYSSRFPMYGGMPSSSR